MSAHHDELRLPQDVEMTAGCRLRDTQCLGNERHTDPELGRIGRPLVPEVLLRLGQKPKDRQPGLARQGLDLDCSVFALGHMLI